MGRVALGATLCAFGLALGACSPDSSASDGDGPPNLLLISIDTLRADRLGCYGYERDTTPALDRFANERAVRFENVIAESSWTLPSHVTLLSGLHPVTHGVREADDVPSKEIELLAERLGPTHYNFAITDGGFLSEGWGFDRGFRSFQAADQEFAKTVREATEYIRHREKQDGPWFAFLHTYDVHCPYDPPEPYFSMFQSEDAEEIEVAGRCGNPYFNEIELRPGQVRYVSDRYDGGVRWVDDALGELFRFLDEEGLWENTIVVVTSDHGEELGEHGKIGHERTLFSESLRIPLLIAAPGLTNGVVEVPVGLADAHAGMLALLGQEEWGLVSRALLGGIRPEDAVPRISDLRWKEALSSRWSPDQHVIFDGEFEALHAFDPARDPREARDEVEEGGLAELGREQNQAYRRLSENAFPADRYQGELPDLRGLGYGD